MAAYGVLYVITGATGWRSIRGYYGAFDVVYLVFAIWVAYEATTSITSWRTKRVPTSV